MRKEWKAFLWKDIRLMASGHFFLLALVSLLLYTCYIQLVYVKTDQAIFPVYLYNPEGTAVTASPEIEAVSSREELEEKCGDAYGVGILMEGGSPSLSLKSSGSRELDAVRGAYALSLLTDEKPEPAEIIGNNDKEMKQRREITCEFLYFELTAVGFLGVAALLFKEKKMGVMKLYAALPVRRPVFLISKLSACLAADLIFTIVFTVLNLGMTTSLQVLPAVLVQAGILSGIMALIGFLCALWLSDFKQFSLFYLGLAIFICTPVFLVGQTGVEWKWMEYNPAYRIFAGMKQAYFEGKAGGGLYLFSCLLAWAALFGLSLYAWNSEMKKEG